MPQWGWSRQPAGFLAEFTIGKFLQMRDSYLATADAITNLNTQLTPGYWQRGRRKASLWRTAGHRATFARELH
jgi:hypothetical protein